MRSSRGTGRVGIAGLALWFVVVAGLAVYFTSAPSLTPEGARLLASPGLRAMVAVLCLAPLVVVLACLRLVRREEASHRRTEARLSRLVPEPCREHHRVTLTLLDESIAMLDRVKGQINGGDVSSLAAMATQGRDLEQKAKEVDAMAAEIKRRYGL